MALTHIHSPSVYVCAVVYPNLLYLDLRSFFSISHPHTPPHPRFPSLYTPLGYQHFNITPLPLTPHKYITFRGTFNYHIGITIFFCLSSCLLPLFLSALLLSSFFLSSSSVVVAYLSPLSLTSSSPVAVDHLARSRT